MIVSGDEKRIPLEDKGCQSKTMKVYNFFSCGFGDPPNVSSPDLPENLASKN
jgi:hypothetical protein